MGRKLDLAGQKFGRWHVLKPFDVNERGEIFWLCRCECGTEEPVRASNLRRGGSLSCGCLQRSSVTTHGMTGTATFKTWLSMKQRCLNPNAPDFHRYGGRGIKICASWVKSFESFLKDMGERPAGKNLDRIDNSKNYTPANCRWATPTEQQRNRRNTPKLKWNGKKLTFADLSEETGIPAKILIWRIGAGWSPEKAFSEPIMQGRGRKRPRKD